MDWTPDEIRRRRDTKGLSQDELGRLLGQQLGLDKPISRRAITNWETGQAEPRGRNLRALDLVLGDAPSVDDPSLSQASFSELLAEITRRYSRAVRASGNAPDLPAGRYVWHTEDAPTARRSRGDSPDHDHPDEASGGQAL